MYRSWAAVVIEFVFISRKKSVFLSMRFFFLRVYMYNFLHVVLEITKINSVYADKMCFQENKNYNRPPT